ncbi:hypothetical protein PDESU_01476 [Pontiella desulfatans]|uniref:Lipocalin-like domain-containing protein n=1 Tax=Pontiella desulfatans TaxID=2750659 RepID=A0A6C2TZ44_PONDE|nr:hypothetical protein [Pontiella desulfatans]VGO12922.1 hypothetical protein PDESU_01476 [Pontiella desulfatans]
MKERKLYKMGRRVALVAMSLCLSMFFTGCGDDDDGDGSIAGTYLFDDGTTLVLTSEGKATITDGEDGSVETFTFKVSGNSLSYSHDEYDDDGTTLIGTGFIEITISGNTLTGTFTVKFDDGSPDFVENFTATKQ